MAAAMVTFSASNGLSLNPGKTQLLLVRGASTPKSAREDFIITVGSETVRPGQTLNFLGVTIDDRLSMATHHHKVAASARAKAGTVARLAAHLPVGPYLRQLPNGIIVGKVTYATAASFSPRLAAEDPPPPAAQRVAQLAMNRAARTITGHRLTDKVPVGDLLKAANLPSLNRATIKAVAMEAWKAFVTHDGDSSSGCGNNYGSRNPLGLLLFDSSSTISRTRAGSNGLISPPLRIAADTFVYAAYRIWNSSRELRAAKTLGEARRAAINMSAGAPL